MGDDGLSTCCADFMPPWCPWSLVRCRHSVGVTQCLGVGPYSVGGLFRHAVHVTNYVAFPIAVFHGATVAVDVEDKDSLCISQWDCVQVPHRQSPTVVVSDPVDVSVSI